VDTQNLRNNLHNRLSFLLWKTDLVGTRFFLSLGAIMWGVLLLWEGDTFSRPTYSLMGSFASETTWGILFLVQGVVAGIGLLWDKGDKTLFFLDALLGCILWTVSCLAMLWAVSPPPAAISSEISAAFAAWWVLVRYKVGDSRC